MPHYELLAKDLGDTEWYPIEPADFDYNIPHTVKDALNLFEDVKKLYDVIEVREVCPSCTRDITNDIEELWLTRIEEND